MAGRGERWRAPGHGSVLEHPVYVLLIEGISRSCSHELVRHRAGFGYSQISQRYVDESHAAFVMPPAIAGDAKLEEEWLQQVSEAQAAYVRAVEGLMQRYEWVTDKVQRRKLAREAGVAQRHGSEDRRLRQRARVAHDARAPLWRRRGAGNPPHGDRRAPSSPKSSGYALLRFRDLHCRRQTRSSSRHVSQSLVQRFSFDDFLSTSFFNFSLLRI